VCWAGTACKHQKRLTRRFQYHKVNLQLSKSPTANQIQIQHHPYQSYEVIPGSIHDGDTLRVRSPKGEVLKVRFACIDAPELKQAMGEESRNHL
jgi:endonuclease YncB( thermonuclease family)